MKIVACYPVFFKDYGIAHACYHLLRNMQDEHVSVEIFGLASDGCYAEPIYQDLIPSWIKTIAYKLLSEEQLQKIGEFLFIRKLGGSPDKIVYLWPSVSLEVYRAFKNKGFTIVYEGVNTHEANSKQILDKEYIELGLPLLHGITEDRVHQESEKMALADYIFSCSEVMTQAYLTNGVSASKILQTSYGLPDNLIKRKESKPSEQLVFSFIGSIGARKGVHLLLDYWVTAGVNAKLRLVGQVDKVFEPVIANYLNNPEIEHIPFTNDLSSIYQSTDVFILPSLEEGSPLVTYLALGAGLPMILSPMAAGGVVQHDIHGIVLDPHNESAWVEAIRAMNNDATLRGRLGDAAFKLAPQYTWQNVAKKRRTLIQQALMRDN
jgi:glycosyltransferase involved in cell wall biosynthesis